MNSKISIFDSLLEDINSLVLLQENFTHTETLFHHLFSAFAAYLSG